MGSKRAMLQNGLGELLGREALGVRRFADLFAGSAAVAVHIARRFAIPVLAFDLQQYSAVLAHSVIGRQTKLNWEASWQGWQSRALDQLGRLAVPKAESLTQELVSDFRVWCAEQSALPITQAYGGHYFSPQQAVWIDFLRATLPEREPAKSVALAALIQAASQCAAAPGHTAQPFQPTRTAKRFLEQAWNRDVVTKTGSNFELLAGQFAQQRGEATVSDANVAAEQLEEGDLVFIDPPYSGVHYSRFYHVLETIAHGSCGEVTGVGRYPASALRPRSRYSVCSESADALNDLLDTVASRGARAILTFPDHDCSNGLSGEAVREIAREHFRINERHVDSKFSSLGGTSDQRGDEAGRSARKHAKELMLVLEPL